MGSNPIPSATRQAPADRDRNSGLLTKWSSLFILWRKQAENDLMTAARFRTFHGSEEPYVSSQGDLSAQAAAPSTLTGVLWPARPGDRDTDAGGPIRGADTIGQGLAGAGGTNLPHRGGGRSTGRRLQRLEPEQSQERFWAARTKQLHRAHVSTFDRLWSCLPYLRPMLTITGDTVDYPLDEDGAGCHDLLGTRCDPYVHKLLNGEDFDYCCHSNLVRAVAPYHLNESDVHDVLNIFQVTG